jgi:hypothetical protein
MHTLLYAYTVPAAVTASKTWRPSVCAKGVTRDDSSGMPGHTAGATKQSGWCHLLDSLQQVPTRRQLQSYIRVAGTVCVCVCVCVCVLCAACRCGLPCVFSQSIMESMQLWVLCTASIATQVCLLLLVGGCRLPLRTTAVGDASDPGRGCGQRAGLCPACKQARQARGSHGGAVWLVCSLPPAAAVPPQPGLPHSWCTCCGQPRVQPIVFIQECVLSLEGACTPFERTAWAESVSESVAALVQLRSCSCRLVPAAAGQCQ